MTTPKLCVYCGGADHPAECGYTQEELDKLTRLPHWIRRLLKRGDGA